MIFVAMAIVMAAIWLGLVLGDLSNALGRINETLIEIRNRMSDLFGRE